VSDIPASKAMWNSPDNGTLQEAARRGEGVAAHQRLVRERAPGLTHQGGRCSQQQAHSQECRSHDGCVPGIASGQ